MASVKWKEQNVEKLREYRRTWYRKNRQKQIAATSARKQKIIQWLTNYKKALSCEICGESDSVCLDFHHADDQSKDFSLSDAATHGYSIKRLLQEIDKCKVLCANCHRKVHRR